MLKLKFKKTPEGGKEFEFNFDFAPMMGTPIIVELIQKFLGM